VSGGFVHVWSTRSIPEGEIVRARLEDEGIPVLVKGEGEGPYRMGPVHLWVPAALEVQARLILDAPDVQISDEELVELAEGADDVVEGSGSDEAEPRD
jgi:hypothetical protein